MTRCQEMRQKVKFLMLLNKEDLDRECTKLTQAISDCINQSHLLSWH